MVVNHHEDCGYLVQGEVEIINDNEGVLSLIGSGSDVSRKVALTAPSAASGFMSSLLRTMHLSNGEFFNKLVIEDISEKGLSTLGHTEEDENKLVSEVLGIAKLAKIINFL